MRAAVKKLYHILPFKKGLFTCVKYIFSPGERIYKHLSFKGVFRVKAGEASFLVNHYGFQVENEIFWKGLEGGWEKQSFMLWIKLCKRAHTILDIGANTGIFALIAGAVNPKAKIIAFEPVERVYQKLEQNIALNNTFNITPVKKALSDADGKAIIYDDHNEHIYSVTVNKSLRSEGAGAFPVEIDIMKLSTYIRSNDIGRIDLVKIDVETHEPEVLEGMEEYLDMFRPAMLVEVLSDETGSRIEKLVSGKNYLFFNIDETHGPRKVSKITASNSFNYLLCSCAEAGTLGLL
jgi:FkbM family methyltransferase